MEIVFSKYANLELEDATHFYNLEFEGLGRRFKEEIKKAAIRISEYPKAWSVETKSKALFCIFFPEFPAFLSG